MIASFWLSFWAWILYVLLFIVLLFGTIAVLGRVAGGRYLRSLVMPLMKVPLFRRWLTKASQAALSRQNPELASAYKKVERMGGLTDPLRAQKAMSTLTAAERRALMDATAQQQDEVEGPMNREQRRRLEKARRDAQRRKR
jgi:hypothetical protein